MKMHEANQKKDEFIFSRAYEGKSFDLISKELDVSKNTLLKWERQNYEIINAFRKIKAVMITESLKLKLENRLERLGEIQDKLFNEIEKLDFANIPPHKTVELFLNVQKALREELSTLTLTKEETLDYFDMPLF